MTAPAPPPYRPSYYPPATAGGTGVLVTQHDGYEIWSAVMEDAVERGDLRFVAETTISGYKIPAVYYDPQRDHHPHGPLRQAQMVLASVCTCRGRLHAACVYPTLQRGEPLDMPEDWRDWVPE